MDVTHDRRWAGDLRSSIRCAAVLLALLLVIDRGEGTLTALRAALWAGLGALLFLVLYPPRVTAGEGRLSSRGLLRKRRVRTDLLVSVRCLDGEDAQKSAASGSLACGATALRKVSERIDRETALTVFRVSGLG
ncbi:hypothetical protein ABT150_34630 [Streptomyces mirabilis]|uniref:hypothetical protein n=1 Tax=Streptomyces mirabilis TaxID=68239 RepID=UPI00331F16EA